MATPGQLQVRLEGQLIQTLPRTMSVLTIGRAPESGLSLPDSLVSRSHAELRLEAQGPVLTDLGSSNGTFIGGQRLLPHHPHVLADGASFRIGRYILTYQASPSAAPPAEPVDEQQLTRQSTPEPTVGAQFIAPPPV